MLSALITHFMRLFYKWLYHPLAFTYDLVAATVSFGHWNEWVRNVLPYISGTRVLELGYGPGHLQKILWDRGLTAVGLDESAQMGRLAKARLRRSGYAQANLTRGLAQALPFPSGYFDTIVSTFPSEYIFAEQTLSEVGRVLHNGGRLIVLPVVWPRNRLSQWLFEVTEQSSDDVENSFHTKLFERMSQAGFALDIQTLETESASLLLLIATKKQ